MIGNFDERADNTEAMEWLINKLSGIISSRILTNEKNEILEMHVLADYSRSPKQIVRDIQSALAAVYDMEIDHRVISVAQIDEGLDTSDNVRLKLNNVQVFAEGMKLDIKIVLSLKDKVFEGTATGMNSPASRPHTVISATLSALHSYLDRNNAFNLIDVRKLSISDMDAYVVVIGYMSGLHNEVLIGSSLVKHDEYHAIIRATLDSVNRILSKV